MNGLKITYTSEEAKKIAIRDAKREYDEQWDVVDKLMKDYVKHVNEYNRLAKKIKKDLKETQNMIDEVR